MIQSSCSCTRNPARNPASRSAGHPRLHRCGHILSRVTILAILLLLASSDRSAMAQGYGYAKSADPLLGGVKSAIAAAREGNAEKVTSAMTTLEPLMDEVQTGLGIDVRPAIETAKAKGDARDLAFELAELVFHQLRLKLEANVSEELKVPLKARRRLEAAQAYYEQILSFAVRRADSKNLRRDHEELKNAFRELRESLGSEGLFGVGKKDPDLAKCRLVSAGLIERLGGVFPQFPKPRPGELGSRAPGKGPEEEDPDGEKPAGENQPAGGIPPRKGSRG